MIVLDRAATTRLKLEARNPKQIQNATFGNSLVLQHFFRSGPDLLPSDPQFQRGHDARIRRCRRTFDQLHVHAVRTPLQQVRRNVRR